MRTILQIEVAVELPPGESEERNTILAIVTKSARKLYKDVGKVAPLTKNLKGKELSISEKHN
jgi:hypothetical protein